MESGSGPLAAANSRHWSGRSVWIFFAPGRFAAKTAAHEGWISWISLDSLVQIETYQWVTRFLAGRIFRALFPGVERRRNGEPAVEAMWNRRIVHGASLTWFLIFCKRLSSEPSFRPASIQKQAHSRDSRGRH